MSGRGELCDAQSAPAAERVAEQQRLNVRREPCPHTGDVAKEAADLRLARPEAAEPCPEEVGRAGRDDRKRPERVAEDVLSRLDAGGRGERRRGERDGGRGLAPFPLCEQSVHGDLVDRAQAWDRDAECAESRDRRGDGLRPRRSRGERALERRDGVAQRGVGLGDARLEVGDVRVEDLPLRLLAGARKRERERRLRLRQDALERGGVDGDLAERTQPVRPRGIPPLDEPPASQIGDRAPDSPHEHGPDGGVVDDVDRGEVRSVECRARTVGRDLHDDRVRRSEHLLRPARQARLGLRARRGRRPPAGPRCGVAREVQQTVRDRDAARWYPRDLGIARKGVAAQCVERGRRPGRVTLHQLVHRLREQEVGRGVVRSSDVVESGIDRRALVRVRSRPGTARIEVRVVRRPAAQGGADVGPAAA